MTILAVEFSSAQRSVAVVKAKEGATAGLLTEVIESRAHGGQALGMISEALREAQLEREQIETLVIGLGPGSYAGIRSAIALAQGWQLATPFGVPRKLSGPGVSDVPGGAARAREQTPKGRASNSGVKLLGLSSADCLTAQAHAEGLSGRVQVVIDAQRNEFYLAGYQLGRAGWHEIEPLRLATLAEVQSLKDRGETLLGPEVTRWFPGSRALFPRAATLGQLALNRSDFISGESLAPIYLRQTQFVKAPPPRSW
jgi:tRNA A37 threonylcarbamoyladenosine modification protein TsaB